MHILTSALKLLGIRAAVKFGVPEVVEPFIIRVYAVLHLLAFGIKIGYPDVRVS